MPTKLVVVFEVVNHPLSSTNETSLRGIAILTFKLGSVSIDSLRKFLVIGLSKLLVSMAF